MGVNRAVEAVGAQVKLKQEFPPERRLEHRVVTLPMPKSKGEAVSPHEQPLAKQVALVERAHPDLGRLGVFWHTQGSGRSHDHTSLPVIPEPGNGG